MEERVFSRFVRYTVPGCLAMVGLSCYILADTFFISNKVGALGLAAMNFSCPVFSVINATGQMLGIGGAIRFAICKAHGETENGNRTFTHVVCAALLLGVFFLLLGAVAVRPIAYLMGADEETIGLTTMYLRVLMSFAPFFVLNPILVSFTRNDGAPRLAMAAMLIGSLTNVVLDYVFVYPLDLGMFGAALATGVAPIVSICIVLLFHVRRGRNTFHLQKGKADAPLLKNCCGLGSAAFIGEFSTSVVMLVFNLVILRLAGNIGVAAYGVVANIAYVVMGMLNGVTQGAQPLISEYYARQMKRQEGQVLRYSLLTAALLGFGMWLILALFAPQIVQIFNSEGSAQLRDLAIPGVRIYFAGACLTGINLVMAAAFAATERAKASFMVSVTRGMIGIVAMVLILSRIWGVLGVWAAFPATEVITLCVVIAVSLCAGRRKGEPLRAE